MMELADIPVLKADARKSLWVRVPLLVYGPLVQW